MKSWALVMLLLAALLAEKALARPGSADADEDEEGLQDDEPNNEPKLPPTIKSSPLTLTPKPGDTVLLPCEAENTPVVSWLNKTRTIAVGDKRLSYKDDKRIIIHPNSTLEIKDVQPSDSGSFTCKVSQGLEVVHHVNVYEAGNGAPVDRLSYSLLIGAVLALFLRS